MKLPHVQLTLAAHWPTRHVQPLLPGLPDPARPCTANFSLPSRGAEFADVLFVEAQPPDAQAIIAEQSRLVRGLACFHPRIPPQSRTSDVLGNVDRLTAAQQTPHAQAILLLRRAAWCGCGRTCVPTQTSDALARVRLYMVQQPLHIRHLLSRATWGSHHHVFDLLAAFLFGYLPAIFCLCLQADRPVLVCACAKAWLSAARLS